MSTQVAETMSLAIPESSPLAPFAVMGQGAERRIRAVKTNIGDGQFRLFDLKRVKVPAGGAISWEIPSATGDSESVKEIRGIIIHVHAPMKSFFLKSIEDGGDSKVPDCFSYDGRKGFGLPLVWKAGDTSTVRIKRPCGDCMHNQWGTARKGEGKGKACSDRTILFILREKDFLPLMIVVPGGSAETWRQYKNGLIAEGIAYCDTITSISLCKQPGPPVFSQMVFKSNGALDDADADRVATLKECFDPVIQTLIQNAAQGQLARPGDEEDEAYQSYAEADTGEVYDAAEAVEGEITID